MSDAVTTAADFRTARLEGEVVTLPSTGRKIRMRAVKPAELLALGDIPEPLADLVIAFLYGSLDEEDYKKFFSPAERREQALDLIKSLNIVAQAAVIEPRVVGPGESVGPEEIEAEDLEDSELRWIFDLAMMGAANLRNFRLQQETPVEPVADVEDPASETESVGGGDRRLDVLPN